MTAYVLGAGPAGLAIVDGIAEASDTPIVVLERGDDIGGLARTIEWEGFGAHDLGPHKIFTLDTLLMERVASLLGEGGWLTRQKRSSIYLNGHYLPYPPSPFSLLGVYGPRRFARMVRGFVWAMLRSTFSSVEAAHTFERDLQTRVGSGIYEVLFKPIALKLWGDPSDLDAKLSKGRVQTPSIGELAAQVLGKKKATSQFEALEFDYPRGGLQSLWHAIREKAGAQCEVRLGSEVETIEMTDDNVSGIAFRDLGRGSSERIDISDNDFVFSTLPLGLQIRLMKPALPPALIEKVKEVVQLNDLILVFLKIDSPQLMEDSWIFVPDPSIPFHRVSEQSSFDPDMTPGGSIVCCEIMSNPSRPMSRESDENLIRLAREGLAKMQLSNFDEIAAKVIRLPRSYPVFRPGFEDSLKAVLSYFDGLGNFRTIGRQGAFNYIGTLDAMDIGYGAARWFLEDELRGGRRAETWQAERNRTSFYPVLD